MAKQEMFKNSFRALLVGICLFTQVATAQPGGGGGERRGPPPEAYDACADLTVGSSCEMTGRRGDTMQGTCIVPRDDEDSLVCAPEGGPGGQSPADQSAQ
jgi:hypothetical protein